MTEGHQDFYKRLTGLSKKHDAMAAGVQTHMRADGLIVVSPKRGTQNAKRMSLWSNLVVFLVGAMAFKMFVLYSLGEATYQQRVDALQAGTQVEQVGAWVTQIDPVTRIGVNLLNKYFP